MFKRIFGIRTKTEKHIMQMIHTATMNDPWGVSSEILSEICRYSE
jgi:hypothetical protein